MNKIYIDLETTGFDGLIEDIIEIFLLKENEDGKEISQLHLFLNPKNKLSNFIINLTKITNEILLDKPKLKDVGAEIINFIGDGVLIGHNINSFDLPFLNQNLKRNGFKKIQNQTIDTIEMARKIDNVGKYVKGYKLIDLCLKYQIEVDDKKLHGAKYDVLLTKKLYLKLKDKISLP